MPVLIIGVVDAHTCLPQHSLSMASRLHPRLYHSCITIDDEDCSRAGTAIESKSVMQAIVKGYNAKLLTCRGLAWGLGFGVWGLGFGVWGLGDRKSVV